MPASLQDFLKGLDLVGRQGSSPVDVNQMVDLATPATDKGLVVVTTDTGVTPDVPDAATTTKWQRYIWLRISLSSVTAYVWNPSIASDPTYLKWQAITVSSIADDSITTAKIVAGAVTDAKILSVDWTKVSNRPTNWYELGAVIAGGDLGGTYPNPTIGANKVTNDKLLSGDADGAVTGDKVRVNTLALKHLIATPKTALFVPRIKSDGSDLEFIQAKILEATFGTERQVPRVSSGAIVYGNPGIIQRVIKELTTYNNTGAVTTPAFSAAAIGIGEGAAFTSQAITPILTTSRSRVYVIIPVSNSGAPAHITAFLYANQDAIDTVRGSGIEYVATSNTMRQIEFTADWAHGSISALSLYLRLGANTGTVYWNGINTNQIHAGSLKAQLIYEEYLF